MGELSKRNPSENKKIFEILNGDFYDDPQEVIIEKASIYRQPGSSDIEA